MSYIVETENIDGENKFHIADVPPDVRSFIMKDGYGYTYFIKENYLPGIHVGFVRVVVIPDSEYYKVEKNVLDGEAKMWYEKHGRPELFGVLVSVFCKKPLGPTM